MEEIIKRPRKTFTKALVLITALFLFAITIILASCEKSNEPIKENWVCTCKHRKGAKDTTVSYQYPQQTKANAITGCDAKEVYLQSIYGPTGTFCSLGTY